MTNLKTKKIEKVVKNKQVVLSMANALTARQRRDLGGETYKPRQRGENETPGWLVSKMVGVYVVPADNHRNDGLKHILSRGTQC